MDVPAYAAHSRRAPRRGVFFGVAALALACMILPPHAFAQCTISGPEYADEGTRFTLCAPSGYTYRWSGPGVAAGTASRCITLNVQSAGVYEYTVTLSSGGAFQDRCTHSVTVRDNLPQGSDRPEDRCAITGPTVMESGETIQLCGPSSTYQVHSYSWAGPAGYRATTRCISVSRPGVYQLTTRNQVTGHERVCSQRVDLQGGSGGNTGDCLISGPDTFEPGTRVRLCGPTGASSYRWTGPSGFISASACINVTRQGSYTLSIRDRFGDTRACTHYLDAAEGPDDADQAFAENCPRTHAFWSSVCRGARGDVSATELSSIARRVDERAQSFNWTDDSGGLCQTLRPTGTVTQRKQAARQLAALLANLSAAELGITAQSGQAIGLDPDTPLSYPNARTIGELAALVDRMLVRGRGSFAGVNRMLQAVNSGRGIGSVCGE